jgi:Mg2+ and Co2+ transporter CorA
MAVAACIDEMNSESTWFQAVIAISFAILNDRTTRRKWLSYAAFLMLGLFACGLWGIDQWLAKSAWRFGIWWIGVMCWTCVVMLFALYDALKAIREERDKMK